MIRRLAKAVLPVPVRLKLRSAYERIEPLFYLGWSVECPCCGAHYREFLPHGRPVRANSRCPRCDAVERHRLLMLFLKHRTKLFGQPMRLLHFAPETTFHRIFSSARNLKYHTTDYSERADVHMDITNLAVPDNTFDAIICMHVLEHIPDDRRAMGELFRVLKPGGWAILQVPMDLKRQETYENPDIVEPADRRRHFGQEDHVRWYGQDFKLRLQDAGFQVTVDDYVRTLPSAQIRRNGLMLDEDIYFCSKL